MRSHGVDQEGELRVSCVDFLAFVGDDLRFGFQPGLDASFPKGGMTHAAGMLSETALRAVPRIIHKIDPRTTFFLGRFTFGRNALPDPNRGCRKYVPLLDAP